MEIKTLIDEKTLKSRIKELADEINKEYDMNETIIAICILKGAVMFYTELVQYLKMPLEMEFVSLSSYGSGKTSSGKVSAANLELPNLKDKKVLIIEDIIDTGLTLSFLVNHLKENCEAKDVKLAVMFDKKCARKYDLTPDFAAFDIDNKFIVGFGLDINQMYRNLPYIGYIED